MPHLLRNTRLRALGVVITASMAVASACGSDNKASSLHIGPEVTTPVTAPATTLAPPTAAPRSSTTTGAKNYEGYRIGDSGPGVDSLKEDLFEVGCADPRDGSPAYDDLTAKSVIQFQSHVHEGKDGWAGPDTLGKLAAAKAAGNHSCGAP